MTRDVCLDIGARKIAGIQRAAGRHRRGADERAIAVHEIESAAVDEQIVPEIARRGRARLRERLVERQPLRVALAPVDRFEIAARRDELVDHTPFAGRQRRAVERHPDGLESGEPPIEVAGSGLHCIGHARPIDWLRRPLADRDGGSQPQGGDTDDERPEHGCHADNSGTSAQARCRGSD
jgi:hypothetical protein